MPSTAATNCPITCGVLGRPEVEAVGDAHRLGAHARQVAHRLGHRLRRAVERVEAARQGVAVGRGGEADARARDEQQRRVRARARPPCSRPPTGRTAPRPGARLANAGLASSARRSAAQSRVVQGRQGHRGGRHRASPTAARSAARRRPAGATGRRNASRPVEGRHHLRLGGDARRSRPRRAPSGRHTSSTAADVWRASTTSSMRSCDSESISSYGVMPCLARRHLGEVEGEPAPGARRHLERRRGEARRRPCPGCRRPGRAPSARGSTRSAASR